ncbi:thiamine diphosphokinase [Marivita sp. GX14005]|uniref:thiamine diphosphokinase n=1 Tax=Marivita sp. GX14005 TaxID=2942276 RepID=UPI002018DEC7|nr:thiamine diphosphokinase [Marivita sp. GX14005]MCL3882378.1 thiamine diphosphokinase [Marivita sp. GX14005]
MNGSIVRSDGTVLLVGGAGGDNRQLRQLLVEAAQVVAADSGADWLHEIGHTPDALIGDLDSVSPAARGALPPDRVRHIAEQDSTDFDKALRSIDAPLTIGIGFLGRRVDHMLAAMTVLCRYPQRAVLLVGEDDVIVHLPPHLDISLQPGTRVSLFPMRELRGRSTGLTWPIDGLSFAPDTRTGTSNRALGPVSLTMQMPGMLLILPASERSALQSALAQCDAMWPAP